MLFRVIPCSVFLLLAFTLPAPGVSPLVKIPNPQTGERARDFGRSMARAGDLLAIGAPQTSVAGNASVGGVWVFRRTPEGNFEYVTQLLPADPKRCLDFGYSVGMTTSTIVVGAPQSHHAGMYSGSAYVFERNASDEWVQTDILAPPQSDDWDAVGEAVAISGDLLALGARGDGQGGSVYVYHRQASGEWQQTAQLRPSDATNATRFGCSVAVGGDRLFVGAKGANGAVSGAGAVYVFSRVSEGLWSQDAKLYASDGAPYEEFGLAVAAWGDRLTVGTRIDRIDPDTHYSQTGSVYVFEYEVASGWAQGAKLRASDSENAEGFGGALYLTTDTLIVGAWGWDEGDTPDLGAAYVWRHDGVTSWSQEARVICPTSEYHSPEMGRSVVLWGDTVLAGAPDFYDPAGGRGQVFLFRHDNGTSWTSGGVLELPDAAAGDRFGFAMTLSDQLALICEQGEGLRQRTDVFHTAQLTGSTTYTRVSVVAPSHIEASGALFSLATHGDHLVVGDYAVSDLADQCGAAYTYRRTETGYWEYEQRLVPTGPSYLDNFGYSVSIWGDTAAVGAIQHTSNENRYSFATVFRLNSEGVWEKEARLGPPNPVKEDLFGWSMALCGDTLAVGHPSWNSGAVGCVHVFARSSDSTWHLEQSVTVSDPQASWHFGRRIALYGDTLAIGDSRYTPSSVYSYCGRVFLFARTNGQWGLRDYLSPGLMSWDYFGASLAMSDGWLVVGAPGRDTDQGDTGAAYVYEIGEDASWSLKARLEPGDGKSQDQFGSAVAVSGTHCLIGAPGHDANGSYAGAAYFCEVASPTPTLTPTPTPTPTPTGRPVIVSHPQDVYVEPGGTAHFQTQATGSPTKIYTWQHNRNPVTPSEYFSIDSSEDTSDLTITNVHYGHPGYYRCLVTNASGTAITREALLSVGGPLAIVGQPGDVTVPLGLSAEFRVGASGTPPMAYTWYHDGNTIAANPSNAADTSSLRIAPVTWADSGLYWCEVQGGYPQITRTSAPARLKILPAGVEPWWELMR